MRVKSIFPPGRQPSILMLRYCAQYGASHKTVQRLGAARLSRMAPHARATLFSALRWDDQRRRYTLDNFGKDEISTKRFFVQKPKGVVSDEKVSEILRLMKLVEKVSA